MAFSICTIWATFLVAATALELPSSSIVFPELLEGRSSDGGKVLKINDDLSLNLKPSSVLADEVAVHTYAADGSPVVSYVKGADYEKGLHRDSENLASVILTQEGGLQVEGVVGPTLAIRPVLARERSPDGRLAHELYVIDSPHHHGDYSYAYAGLDSELSDEAEVSAEAIQSTGTSWNVSLVVETDYGNGTVDTKRTPVTNGTSHPPESGYKDYATPGTSEDSDTEGSDPMERADPNTKKDRKGVTYYPEMHAVFDSAFASEYEFNEDKLLRLLSMLINGVNLRYESMSSPVLQTVVIGITISNTSTQEKYIKKHDAPNAHLIDGHETLQETVKHFKKEKHFRDADMFYIITGGDIAAVATGGSMSTSVAGYATVAGACTKSKVGICDKGSEPNSLVYTLAHEIGHTLGCVHDGENNTMKGYPDALSCNASDGYIMAPVQTQSSQHSFSKCSEEQMHHLIQQKDRKCIKSRGSDPDRVQSGALPGHDMTRSGMCAWASRSWNKTLLFDTKKPVNGCQVECKELTGVTEREQDGYIIRTTTWTLYDLVALDGMRCVDGDTDHLCIKGQCTTHPRYKASNATEPPPAEELTTLTTLSDHHVAN